MDRKHAIRERLLAWYQSHRRELPWRTNADPYAVWVSEMMLQQTQVATVIPYFQAWMQRFPTVMALANAEEADVLHAWQGLGYYSRARNLLAGARRVKELHSGEVPKSVSALRELPGIGPYTAGAIASIAFSEPAPIVDGNVIRVLSRLFALEGDPTKAAPKRALWQLAEALVPQENPGDFNQAMMELGATVCTPQKPSCKSCPVQPLCQAHASGRVHEFPQVSPRPKATAVQMLAAVVQRGDEVLLGKLGPQAPRWSGMWQFPNAESGVSPADDGAAARSLAALVKEQTGLSVEARGLVVSVRHQVTRYRITLDAYRCEEASGASARAGAPFSELAWVAPAALSDFALPKAHRTIANSLLQQASAQLSLL